MITIIIGSGHLTGHLADKADLLLAGPAQMFGFARRPPNAVLDLKNSDTGAVYASGSSAAGNYKTVVPRGTYELTVNAEDFQEGRG